MECVGGKLLDKELVGEPAGRGLMEPLQQQVCLFLVVAAMYQNLGASLCQLEGEFRPDSAGATYYHCFFFCKIFHNPSVNPEKGV